MNKPTNAELIAETPTLLKPTLPHWLRMALDRIAAHGKQLDSYEYFPCLKNPGQGCPLGSEWCVNCERAYGVYMTVEWIKQGMPLPLPSNVREAHL